MKYSFRFWIIVFAHGIMVAGYSISFPFLAIYLTQHKGFDIEFTGAYFSIVMLVSSLSNTFSGSLSDHMGRKKIMFYSLITRSLFSFIIAFFMYFELNPFYILILNFFSSLTAPGFASVSMTYISDITEESERVSAYSILRVAGNAGWAAGPTIGGFIADISYSLAFASSGFIFLLASILVFYFVDDVIKKKRDAGENISFKKIFGFKFSKNFKTVLLLSFLVTSVTAQLVIPVSLYSKKYLGFSEKEIGFLFTLNGLIVIFIQYFIGMAINSKNIVKALSISCIFYGVGYLIFGYSRSYGIAILAISIITLGEVIFSPSISALVSDMSPTNRKGGYMGFFSMTSDFGRAAGVFIGTFLIGNFSAYLKEIPWIAMLLISFFSSYGFIRFSRRYHKFKNDEIPNRVITLENHNL